MSPTWELIKELLIERNSKTISPLKTGGRYLVHLQVLDIIIVNLLQSIVRTLSSTEYLQIVHNATL